MADEADQAQGYNEDFQAYVLRQHQRKSSETSKTSQTWCVDCDQEIPEKRRLVVLGCCRCISCQTDFELHEHWRV